MRGEPRRQVLRGGFRTADIARAAMYETQRPADDPHRVEPSRLTIAEYLGALDHESNEASGWLGRLRPRVRGGTFRTYELNVRRHAAPAIGSMRVQATTRAHVKTVYARTAAAGLSEKSIHNAHVVLYRAL